MERLLDRRRDGPRPPALRAPRAERRWGGRRGGLGSLGPVASSGTARALSLCESLGGPNPAPPTRLNGQWELSPGSGATTRSAASRFERAHHLVPGGRAPRRGGHPGASANPGHRPEPIRRLWLVAAPPARGAARACLRRIGGRGRGPSMPPGRPGRGCPVAGGPGPGRRRGFARAVDLASATSMPRTPWRPGAHEPGGTLPGGPPATRPAARAGYVESLEPLRTASATWSPSRPASSGLGPGGPPGEGPAAARGSASTEAPRRDAGTRSAPPAAETRSSRHERALDAIRRGARSGGVSQPVTRAGGRLSHEGGPWRPAPRSRRVGASAEPPGRPASALHPEAALGTHPLDGVQVHHHRPPLALGGSRLRSISGELR